MFPFFAYFGPETTLPLATIAATVFGIVMVAARAGKRRIAWLARKVRNRFRVGA
jgi:hypothetical protein